jgi:prolyl oligopeptidase
MDMKAGIGITLALMHIITLAACRSGSLYSPESFQVPGGGEQFTNEVVQMVEPDEFLWLEEIDGTRALTWTGKQKLLAENLLERDLRFESLKESVSRILTTDQRIDYGHFSSGYVYNFWQDKQHVRGIFRRTSLVSYASADTIWDLLLDIDELAIDESENWVFNDYDCFGDNDERCLIHLSRGGTDAAVVREFDTVNKVFVKDGFQLPQFKSRVTWFDEDSLLIATDFGPDSLTESGYARSVRLWQRGTAFSEAKVILQGKRSDTMVVPMNIKRPEGRFTFIMLMPQFFRGQYYYLGFNGKQEEPRQLPFPEDARFVGVFEGLLLAVLRSDWEIGGQQTLHAGSLVSIDMRKSLASSEPINAKTIFNGNSVDILQDVTVNKDTLLLSVLRDVKGRLLVAKPGPDGQWTTTQVSMPENGNVSVTAVNTLNGNYMVKFESFLAPPQLFLFTDEQAEGKVIRSLPADLDSNELTVEQRFANSTDGTRIPYFVVHAADLVNDGNTPTLMEGYGGFEIPLAPEYLSALEIEWLRSGGVYVLANIRGGGEYGPQWHQAALLANRQRAYDDFIAVSEDLISSGITSPRRLGIRGRSNGGLLVGVVTTQRPDLYNAVICAVPLLDMLRYHQLSAGASWMAEYGNPDDPGDREFISKYSPYQNLHEDTVYPRVFFWTNPKDDRVHPGHARRMAAKMHSQGHQILYWESHEGGHAGSANLAQQAHITALELTYLMQYLKD